MQSDESAINGFLVRHWNEFITTLQSLNGSAEVQPSDGWSIFKQAGGGSDTVANFAFGPVCFKMPERACHSQLELFVVTEGRIGIRRDLYKSERIYATDNFSTHVAYFRLTATGAEHVYGAHYDFALDELGHPIFHSQIKSFATLWSTVEDQFHQGGAVVDCVKGMLKTVRVPTAQMDVFSFCLQLFADHLLLEGTKVNFDKLVAKSTEIKGAAFQAPRLAEESARTCYRSPHWYPV
jgi:hypothetical protein